MRRRDSTCIFYDILFLARKGVTKTRVRRELGLTFGRSEERLSFLLEKRLLRKEPNGVLERYVATKRGHRLLYFMSRIEEEIGAFFPNRKGKCFAETRSTLVEKELVEFLFDTVTERDLWLNRNLPVDSILTAASPIHGPRLVSAT